MLIFYQLLPHCRRQRIVVVVFFGVSVSLFASRLWRLVVELVVIGASSSLLFRYCWQRCYLLWLHLSDSAPRCCSSSWVFYLWRSLIVGVIVGFSSLVPSLLGLLLSVASRCCFWRLSVVGGGGVAAFY